MNHIVIIGFMGSGKTRVGKRLAKDLGLPFIDVDRLIVKKMNIYLKGSAATLIKRLEGSNNPTLEGTENKEEKIKKLLKQRDPVYEKFADIKVVTGVKPFDELIAEIEEKLKA